MNKANIEERLANRNLFHVQIYSEVDSTNETLAKLARHGAPEWTVVLAERQLRGKGRYHRRWHSPPNCGIWMSVLLRPTFDVKYLNLINLLAAWTLSHYLEMETRSTGSPTSRIDLKWPNDLLVAGKKLSGILLESSFTGSQSQHVILGIGVNINQTADDFPAELRGTATSLHMLTGVEWQRESLVSGFLELFYENYQYFLPNHCDEIINRYQQKVLSLGRRITVQMQHKKVSGIFSGLTPEGYLVLNCGGINEIISTGEIFGTEIFDYNFDHQ